MPRVRLYKDAEELLVDDSFEHGFAMWVEGAGDKNIGIRVHFEHGEWLLRVYDGAKFYGDIPLRLLNRQTIIVPVEEPSDVQD